MAIVSGLLLMLAISVIAVTAAGNMALQHRQAANFEDRALAASGADLAASYATARLMAFEGGQRDPGCLQHCIMPTGILRPGTLPAQPEFESGAWWRQQGTPVGNHSNARWLIEEIYFVAAETSNEETGPGVGYYRIYGRGAGLNPGSIAVTETIVARPWGASVQASEFPPTGPLSAFCDRLGEPVPCGTLSWRRRR